jgi:predicted TIM-barrel fold metal-dependent hydrolase
MAVNRAQQMSTDEPAPSRKPSRLRRLLRAALVCGVVLVVGGLMARAALFRGPYRTPSGLPAEAVIDLHCHAAGLGAGDSGCFVSKELRQSYKFDLYLRAFGTSRKELESEGDGVVIDHISRQLAESRHVGKAVLLAIDGVVDARGELDLAATETYVPNEFIARGVARHTNLLFGASINPLRHDALARLEWAATNGAVLVKWIPPIMQIDPADERITPFYHRLHERQIPLLVHTGFERTFTRSSDQLGDPERLRLPLRLGVTVIAAHVASTGESEGASNFERLRKLMREFPNLYADISALTQVNRLGALREALAAPECDGRLVYGTDFPLMNMAIVSPWYFPLNLTRARMAEIAAIQNPWDRDVALKQALGVPAAVFQGPRNLLPRRR